MSVIDSSNLYQVTKHLEERIAISERNNAELFKLVDKTKEHSLVLAENVEILSKQLKLLQKEVNHINAYVSVSLPSHYKEPDEIMEEYNKRNDITD